MWFSVTYFLRGCIANRHTTSQRGGGVSKNGKEKRHVFSEPPHMCDLYLPCFCFLQFLMSVQNLKLMIDNIQRYFVQTEFACHVKCKQFAHHFNNFLYTKFL